MVEARTEIARIIEANPNMKIILKVDTEGSEFRIFENLCGAEALGHIDIIMMEYHANPTRIEEILMEEGYISFRVGFWLV